MPGPEDLSTQEVAPSPFTPREPVPDVITTAAALGEYAERLRAATGPLALDAERASGFKYSQRAYLVQLRREGVIAAGARVLLGGSTDGLAGFFYPPTVLVDIPDDAPAAREELFGPVASVFRVADVITVLVNGQLIACGSPEAVRNSPEVRVAYLGEH